MFITCCDLDDLNVLHLSDWAEGMRVSLAADAQFAPHIGATGQDNAVVSQRQAVMLATLDLCDRVREDLDHSWSVDPSRRIQTKLPVLVVTEGVHPIMAESQGVVLSTGHPSDDGVVGVPDLSWLAQVMVVAMAKLTMVTSAPCVMLTILHQGA